jgi:hypothetical protein
MPYTLSVSEDGSYILLKVKGEITRESSMVQNLDVHTLGRRLGINRYLVDLTEARNVETACGN